MTDLSVLIPARNEMWLRRTVEDVLSNIRGNTEVIVVLDGAWAEPQLVPHERVTVIHRPESIGQRAATNEAARVSTAKYVMKLDAHCMVGEGFDVKLLLKPFVEDSLNTAKQAGILKGKFRSATLLADTNYFSEANCRCLLWSTRESPHRTPSA